MNSDESPRNMQYPSNRKPLPPKNQVYSPSSSYNYNGGQSQHGGNHGNHGNQPYGNQQHQRRKPMPFKRDSMHGAGSSSGGSSASDKLSRQNDIIIRLLKEIRDRLPAPPVSTVVAESSETDMVDEAVALIQENIAADSEPEPEAEAEQDSEELGPTLPAAAAPPVHLDDEELDEVANGNR
jgi:hypothetical protein